jgi:2-polyprenyl-6-methoxyphenol hydroxylase-like FAD-dependent oxidoreductase
LDTDVLIVGAGPVGLSLAACLCRHGTPFRIVDQNPVSVGTSNAIALHARSLELLSLLGISGQLIERGVWAQALELNGGGRILAHIDFKDLDSGYPGMLAIPQDRTERILNQHLSNEGVTIERALKLVSFNQDQSSVRATLEHNDGSLETIQAAWLVGCDGANSSVRRILELPFETVLQNQQFVLADLRIGWPLPFNQFTAFFHPEGAVYVAPLPEERHRVIVDVTAQKPSARDAIGFEQLRLLFSRRVPLAAQLSDAIWIAQYEANPGYVSAYRDRRVFVAGAAAHVHRPAGSPEVNTGIQDAFNLAWKLALAGKTQSPSRILDSYSRERRHVVRAVFALYDGVMQAVAERKPAMQHLRNLTLPLLSGWDAVPRLAVAGVPETGLNYRKSSAVLQEGQFAAAGPHAGDRAPLPAFNGRNLLQCLDPAAHTLLLFTANEDTPDHISLLSAIRRDAEAAYSGLIHGYVLVPSQAASVPSGSGLLASGRDLLIDSGGEIHAAYGATKPCLYLIRPDAYIAYQAEPPDGAALHRFLRETYGLTPLHQKASQ